MEIGIVGCGVVGGTFAKMLTIQGHSIKKSDMYKNYFDDISKADIVFICINDTDKEMTNIKSVFKEVAKTNQKGIIVIRTTVIPGTTDEFIELYPERKIAFLPEFLTERNAEYDTFHPDKVVIGTEDNEVFEILKELFKDIICNEKVIQVKPLEAELIKVGLNSLAVIKVVFAEQMNDLATHYGVDYKKIYKGFYLDKFTKGEHLIAGKDGYRGANGKCLPKDIGFLCYAGKKNYINLPLVELAQQLNKHYLKGEK